MPPPKGHPRYGGRQKGTPNKATADIRAAARDYAPQALETLIKLLQREDSPASQLGAARELLDRGFGKPTQLVAGDPDGDAIKTVTEIVLRGVRAGE
jgi:hypothetical protein